MTQRSQIQLPQKQLPLKPRYQTCSPQKQKRQRNNWVLRALPLIALLTTFAVVPVADAFSSIHGNHPRGMTTAATITTLMSPKVFDSRTQSTRRRSNSNSNTQLSMIFSPFRRNKNEDDGATEVDPSGSGGLSRRQVVELAVASTGIGISVLGTRQVQPTDYGLWGIFPVGPYRRKKTIFETIVPNQVWTLEQKFGILNVQVPLRMTILKLSKNNELLVYNPIAMTNEALDLIQENILNTLPPDAQIKYIVVGSCALEHKVYASVMSQKFPKASVYLQPGQYSFPVDLPTAPVLGFPPGRTLPMPQTKADAPTSWQTDLNWAILGPIISRDGAFGETVFLHKATQTLLVTDTCIQVTEQIPPTYDYDPAPLLYHARDTVTDVVEDTPETRLRGWKRIALFGLFFTPSAITIKDTQTALKERRPDINPDFAGIYPWDWTGNEEASWKALTGSRPGGNPLVAPILQVLLLNRSPVEVLEFADQVAQWSVKRIIPCHFENNLNISAQEYRAAFDFLTAAGVPPGYPKPLPADLETLYNAEQSLIESGAIAPRPPPVGGSATRDEILQQTVYRCRKNVCAPRAAPSSSSSA